MGDVSESREYPGEALAAHLRKVIGVATRRNREGIRSPLTVTLGDEFQGIVRSLSDGVRIILSLEQALLEDPLRVDGDACPYRFRYVLHEGIVESPVNPEIAHNMLGPGLTRARELLTEPGRSRPHYRIDIGNPTVGARLERLFFVYESLRSDWSSKDFSLICALLEDDDDAAVAERFNRHRTTILRRRVSLKIREYQVLQSLLREISEDAE